MQLKLLFATSERVNNVQLPELVPEPTKIAHWVSEYDKTVRDRQLWYLRYYWMENRKTCHVHVPGGAASSPIVQHRRLAIEGWISEGKTPDQICSIIRSWSRGRGWNLNKNRTIPAV